MNGSFQDARLPWLAQPLRRALQSLRGHAVLVHGPNAVGQFELSFLLAAGWLCENDELPVGQRPCGVCPSCRLVQARSHPDLLILVPEASREAFAWAVPTVEVEEGGDGGTKRKPSREIRVEAIRLGIALATTTSARGRGKVVVVHPAERLNPIAANAFLKTLEEPAGAARFVLSSAAPEDLLPTIRSRCQSIRLSVPADDDAKAWLAARGIENAEVLLAGCGGRPQEVFEWAERGVDANAWRALPGQVARGEAQALHGWPLPVAVDVLQRICHDALAIAHGAEARFFPRASFASSIDAARVLRWAGELARVAGQAEHPIGVDLAVETLVGQGREALKTARLADRGRRALSLNSPR